MLALGVGLARSEWVARRALERPRRVALALALGAGLLSAGYLAHYLRGGPRIIDATSYYLEARALARGFFAMPILEPTGAFRGRFLLTPPGATALAVLFPPGYPALLALGFVAGAPLAVGPILGVLLCLATFAFARQLFGRDDVALCAAALSLLSAALRYHTADTMSHGFAALLLVLALSFALRGGRATLLAGLALGWLVATRPVTGMAASFFALLLTLRRSRASVLWLAAGALPGLALFGLHQHVATGQWLGSSQLRYYALADGPPGCFRYGFGRGIGCMFEHGDFVRGRLSDGYGPGAALGTTWRRLWLHVADIANFEPLALLLPFAVHRGRRQPEVRLLGLVPIGLVVAYVPFYFDGNYPGGGARMFAEALPFEHVLLAWVALELRIARFVPALALAGFALHTSRAHEALADREGGRPMFEPAVLAGAGVQHGLLFTATDHGFMLAHVPGASDATRELVVARYRGDAHDWLLWNQLGRPPAYRYLFSAETSGPAPSVVPFAVPPSRRFEAEAEWPPLDVGAGWTHPDYPSASCAAGSPALRLHGGAGEARVTLAVGSVGPGPVRLVPRWVAVGSGPAWTRVEVGDTRWEAAWDAEAGTCLQTPGPPVEGRPEMPVVVSSRGDLLSLDAIEVWPAVPQAIRKSVDN